MVVMSGDKAGLQPVGVDELKVSPPLAGRRTRVLRTVLTGSGLRDTSPRHESIGSYGL